MKRRTFVKRGALAGIGASYALSSFNSWASSPNETVNLAIIGTGGRATVIPMALPYCKNIRLSHVCDVDEMRLTKFQTDASEALGYPIKRMTDFRKLLDSKEVDAVFIATPEHWHAPMAIMAMEAGKHVYVEKPCSHNLFENDLLKAAYEKYGMVCQMGNQQRSSVTTNQAILDIREGKIGEVYFGKAWYANTRGSIGIGKEVAVPENLDWDLWQGPAPREAYRDNVHPYNWHWFKTWGTGEIHNNGTHEIDVCRWALGVDYPHRVTSSGGRFHFEDDWQFFDTQTASFEYSSDKKIEWEGKSCNGFPIMGRGRGALIHGTEGSILLDREGYITYDLAGVEVDRMMENTMGNSASTQDTTGFDGLTVRHLQNFVGAIRESEKLNAPIDDASISTHLCHLGNISQIVADSLNINPENGAILAHAEAQELYKRSYEPGWEPKI